MKYSFLQTANTADYLSIIHKPILYRVEDKKSLMELEELLHNNVDIFIHDEMYSQLRELIKSEHPTRKISDEDYQLFIEQKLNGKASEEYGVWVYYPWNKKLVHLLDEKDFITVRTNRNQYKITQEEHTLLGQKAIGIIGLSVGQSVALTLAMERSFGELRLADFDTLELSNLNRIRTGVHNLGMLKTIAVAREIAELDPYLNITCFHEGLTAKNIDRFFNEGGKLDLLIDECDGLDMKIIAREKAKSLGIPVVMDTSDRGMLDIERFDLEPERPILHGLAGGLKAEHLSSLTNEEKIPYMLEMVGFEQISGRMKASMLEVNQSITTWPQLASSVLAGGAAAADVSRRILLNQLHISGRFYFDIESIVSDAAPIEVNTTTNQPAYLDVEKLKQYALSHSSATEAIELGKKDQDKIALAAIAAPSGGNNQPWKIIAHKGSFFVWHEAHDSYSLLDYNHYGSEIGLGAALENMMLEANKLGYNYPNLLIHPDKNEPRLVSILSFNHSGLATQDSNFELANAIEERHTNRMTEITSPLDLGLLENLEMEAQTEGGHIQWISDEHELAQLGLLVGRAERIRLLNKRGHTDTMINELRWTDDEVHETRNGIDIKTLEAKASDIAGLKLAKDPQAMAHLKKWGLGSAMINSGKKSITTASALGMISLPKETEHLYFNTGRILQRVWLRATALNISFQPVSPSLFLIERAEALQKEDLDEIEVAELLSIRDRMNTFFKTDALTKNIFLFRVFEADKPIVRSLRKTLNDVYISF
jgi:hypothetical protein